MFFIKTVFPFSVFKHTSDQMKQTRPEVIYIFDIFLYCGHPATHLVPCGDPLFKKGVWLPAGRLWVLSPQCLPPTCRLSWARHPNPDLLLHDPHLTFMVARKGQKCCLLELANVGSVWLLPFSGEGAGATQGGPSGPHWHAFWRDGQRPEAAVPPLHQRLHRRPQPSGPRRRHLHLLCRLVPGHHLRRTVV